MYLFPWRVVLGRPVPFFLLLELFFTYGSWDRMNSLVASNSFFSQISSPQTWPGSQISSLNGVFYCEVRSFPRTGFITVRLSIFPFKYQRSLSILIALYFALLVPFSSCSSHLCDPVTKDLCASATKATQFLLIPLCFWLIESLFCFFFGVARRRISFISWFIIEIEKGVDIFHGYFLDLL